MKTSNTIKCGLTILACVFFLDTGSVPASASAGMGAEVRIVPEETDELLANPGMG